MHRRLALLVPGYVGIFVLCYAFAYELRFEFRVPGAFHEVMRRTLPAVVAVKLLAFLVVGDWRRSFRYVTMVDVLTFTCGAGLATSVLWLWNWSIPQEPAIPRSVLLIDGMLLVLVLGVMRGGIRYYYEALRSGRGHSRAASRAVIYGTQANAVSILRTLWTSDPGLKIVGFVDDGGRCGNTMIAGVRVYCLKETSLDRILRKVQADHLLIPSAVSGKEVREIVRLCAGSGIQVHVIPEVHELVGGRYKLAIREVTINDLLRREPAELDVEAIRRCVGNRRVLVTGAAGSIGAELCRQLYALHPASLVLLDKSEYGLFEMESEFRTRIPAHCETHFVLGDILDTGLLNQVFEDHQPEIVFHAAAYKHVPMVERNVQTAIRNNVFGTRNVLSAADAAGVERFVLVSTDKAVRPSSVMGGTKLLAEHAVQEAASRSQTKFMTVRFGNVLNSSGSVVPIFRQQIEAGGPVTVTDPEMERFFLTIPEAVQLVLQAGAIGDSGDVLVLEMGDPVRIVDLARDMIFLSGLRYPDDVDIVFTGIRPGEKLREELFYESEHGTMKVHDKIFRVRRAPFDEEAFEQRLQGLEQAVRESRERATAVLWETVELCQTEPPHEGPRLRSAA